MQVTGKVGALNARNCVGFPGLVLAVLICLSSGIARAGDEDDDSANGVSSAPNVYLDMRTTYARVPAGALAVGFGNSSLLAALQSAAISNAGSLAAIAGGAAMPGAQSVVVDLPMTIDVNDNVSLYAGVSASSTSTPMTGWSSVAITSWNLGFQADLYNQNGGSIPTLSWQSTITQTIPNGPFATTSFTNVFEFDYAFDQDETRGLLAGVQDTRVVIGSQLATIHSDIMGYVGRYYQWPNNWKLTSRAGVQVFGGAELLGRASVSSFTQPIVRLDLDRMDDNDNRLFGVTAQIMWVPKPTYQITLRTPLYFASN
ncbi:hypothetical protein [Bradyrhizobium sp. 33ap4]|uniref:hypothetical protein n=1 Tax=Bradyrhizobium sp. 33ap4 TaxID=3061630 RepID=UPI002930BBD5|nr:hypothetical protein [Bradyrhizobium sp. 33ap4]